MGSEDNLTTREAENPLRRWSRRKQAARLESEQDRDVAQSPTEPPAQARTDAQMPSLELLHGESDLSDFFSVGVSDELRRRAFRQVFSRPRFNVTDGLDDYAGDYTRYRPLADLVTAGLRRHRARWDECVAKAFAETKDGETMAAENAPAPVAGEEITPRQA